MGIAHSMFDYVVILESTSASGSDPNFDDGNIPWVHDNDLPLYVATPSRRIRVYIRPSASSGDTTRPELSEGERLENLRLMCDRVRGVDFRGGRGRAA